MASDPKSLDLSLLDPSAKSNEGFELQLLHPVTKAPTGAFITIMGQDSNTYKDVMHDRYNTFVRSQASGNTKRDSSEEVDAKEIELLTACTKAFRNVTFEGSPLPFTHSNALKLYKIAWVRQQVNAAIVDITNFLPKPN